MFARTTRVAPEKRFHRPPVAALISGGLGEDMAKMTYGEQLKHPNWQRKRLEVLARAQWQCESCSSTDSTLHVHHRRYIKGRLAWEYEDSNFLALCESCHACAHEDRASLDSVLACLDPSQINAAANLLYGFFFGHMDDAATHEVEYSIERRIGAVATLLSSLSIEQLDSVEQTVLEFCRAATPPKKFEG